MKTVLKNLFAVVCLVAMTVSFTSCKDTGDDPGTYYYYKAGGEILSVSTSADAWEALFIIPEYNETIANLFNGSNYVLGQHDSEVIKACDELYKRHKAKQTPLEGYVTIERSKLDKNGDLLDTVVLKEYTYNQ